MHVNRRVRVSRSTVQLTDTFVVTRAGRGGSVRDEACGGGGIGVRKVKGLAPKHQRVAARRLNWWRLTSGEGKVIPRHRDVTASMAKMRLTQLAEKIINVLVSDPNAVVNVLEVQAGFPSGVSDQVKRAVSEAARAWPSRRATGSRPTFDALRKASEDSRTPSGAPAKRSPALARVTASASAVRGPSDCSQVGRTTAHKPRKATLPPKPCHGVLAHDPESGDPVPRSSDVALATLPGLRESSKAIPQCRLGDALRHPILSTNLRAQSRHARRSRQPQ